MTRTREAVQLLRSSCTAPDEMLLCTVLEDLLDAQDAQEARHAQKIREMRLLHDRAVKGLEERLERQGRLIAGRLAVDASRYNHTVAQREALRTEEGSDEHPQTAS